MTQETRREHQIVMVSPTTWQNDCIVYDIHLHEGVEYGYCDITPRLTFLVREENGQPNVWQVVGWLRP